MSYFKDFLGKIEGCKSHIIKCPCCSIKKVKVYLLPREFEKSDLNKKHLEIINDNYLGGKIAICNKLCSENDLKPFDCKSYPYSPFIDKNGNLILKKSTKCPLSKNELSDHKEKVFKMWKKIVKNSKAKEWIKSIRYDGYEYIEE